MTNDLAADWLLHGVAAAQAGEKAEARDLLQHALDELDIMAEVYGRNDPEARETAWYWLSRIADDPQQQRDYLENILASNPTHPEARRDLAIMNGRLKPEEIVDPNKLDAAVAPPAAPAPAAVRRFVCPQCGGKLSFNPKKQAMACEYCGYQGEGEGVDAGGSALTAGQDFSSALYTARAHRWEIPTERILSCQACGAHFTLPPSRVTGECPFCGSAHIVKSEDGAELIEPGGVIPFQFDEQGAIGRLRQWLSVQLPAKNNLKQAAFARPRPVYFPFWVFNVNGELTWRGMVPQYRSDANVLVWVPRDGSELAIMDNLLVAASHSLPATLVDALGAPATAGGGSPAGRDASSVQRRRAENSEFSANGQFDWSALAPYEANYLADWPAEIYQISLADASLVARGRAFEDAKRRSSPGPEIQHLTYHGLGISIDTYRLVLLPIWVSEVHLKDKICPLVVNGQSGAVYGSLPRGGLGGLLSGLLGGLLSGLLG